MSRPVLVDPQQAMWDYLDALLREIPEMVAEEEEAAAPAAEAPVVAAKATVAAEEIQDWGPAAPAAEAPPAEAEVEPAVAAMPRPAPAARAAGEPPEWAQEDFQALLFQVDGLTLAVPLVKLHSVIPWPEAGLASVPNRPDWCLGLLQHREQTLTVVDTTTLVIPADKRAGREPELPRHLLIVGDGRWGLSCSRLGDVVRLAPEEVKWRSAGGRRPWLAGTVMAHLCALMDTEAFARMLEAGEKS